MDRKMKESQPGKLGQNPGVNPGENPFENPGEKYKTHPKSPQNSHSQLKQRQFLRDEQLKFLNKIALRRNLGQHAVFWRTSPFEHTLHFTSCVDDLEETEHALGNRLGPQLQFESEEDFASLRAAYHSSLALAAKACHEELEVQNGMNVWRVKRIHRILERAVREEFERELRSHEE